jgi:hypothetical protein
LAYFEGGIFFTAEAVPPTLEIATQGLGANLAQAVLFAYIFEFDDGI